MAEYSYLAFDLVAVETAFQAAPLTDPGVRNYLTGLLSWVFGVKAHVRIAAKVFSCQPCK